MVFIAIYNSAAIVIACIIIRVERLWSKLYSSALCGIQSKPIYAHGAIATMLNTLFHQLFSSGNPGAKLLHSTPLKHVSEKSKRMPPTRVRAIAVCVHAACLMPRMFNSPMMMINA